MPSLGYNDFESILEFYLSNTVNELDYHDSILHTGPKGTIRTASMASANHSPIIPIGHGSEAQAVMRERVLDEAKRCVLKNRNSVYGSPEDNFKNTADVINAQFSHKLKENFSSSDVSILMICLKMARLKTTPGHFDSWVDLAGYAACGAECAVNG